MEQKTAETQYPLRYPSHKCQRGHHQCNKCEYRTERRDLSPCKECLDPLQDRCYFHRGMYVRKEGK